MSTASPSPCAIVYSGGTDSTCVAALAAEKHAVVHLLTYYELGTRNSPAPTGNVRLLRDKYPAVSFAHHVISTDRLVRFISYEHYLHYLLTYRLYVLATPGFSSLSWHVRTLLYCRQHGIPQVYDGLTRELMQFPGHMDPVIAEFRRMYGHFGIAYDNPVRDWETPPDIQFLDRLIVDQHGYCLPSEQYERELRRTTGQYLYDRNILPRPNVKGSPLDRAMQHDCYPFVLYNVMAFWVAMNLMSYEQFCNRIAALFREKIAMLIPLLSDYLDRVPHNRLSRYIEDAP